MIKQKLSIFLTDSLSQKEVSLIIAENENELAHYQKWLNDSGYKDALNAGLLLANIKHHKKLYLTLDDTGAKEAYDFAIQYPTSQVELFDPKTMKAINESFDQKNASVVFLATKHQLAQLEKQNYDYRSITGMAFRDEVQHA